MMAHPYYSTPHQDRVREYREQLVLDTIAYLARPRIVGRRMLPDLRS